MRRISAAALGIWIGLGAGPAWARLDWSGYDRLLRAHVRDGVVDYRALAEERGVLDRLAAALAEADPAAEGGRQQQLAAWLNAYNALVLTAVLDGKQPSNVLTRLTFFKTDQYRVFGQRMSLHDLENARIRPSFRDARIHFALVCASRSCPKLRSEAYVGAKLDPQLEDQARWFLASAERNRFEAASKTARISMIFKWYAEDFTREAGSIGHYLQRYAPAAARAWLTAPDAKIEYLDYDWSLNGTR